MRINTNVGALNAYRNLNETNAAVSSSMQKLSSGFRINKAGDDAAGLGIANKLRADTRAMTQASKNGDQANSVLQIAEGATGSIQKMLERMKELATQAGSDSVDTAGRARINAEFGALKEEITRTVDTTKFQGSHLLKSTEATTGSPAVPGTPASDFDAASDTMTAGGSNTGSGNVTVDGEFSGSADATISLRVDGGAFEYSTNGTDWTAMGGTSATVAGVTIDVSAVTGEVDGDSWTIAATAATAGTPEVPAAPASGGAKSFLVGSSAQYDGADTLDIAAMNLSLGAAGLNIESAALTDIDTSRAALTAIDAAMETVNTTLGTIGATQNRLEFAQTNLKTTIQNFSAAESVIRDLDMAEEMTKFSKNNILAQAGTAMLAQANQSAQGVLQLLRG